MDREKPLRPGKWRKSIEKDISNIDDPEIEEHLLEAYARLRGKEYGSCISLTDEVLLKGLVRGLNKWAPHSENAASILQEVYPDGPDRRKYQTTLLEKLKETEFIQGLSANEIDRTIEIINGYEEDEDENNNREKAEFILEKSLKLLLNLMRFKYETKGENKRQGNKSIKLILPVLLLIPLFVFIYSLKSPIKITNNKTTNNKIIVSAIYEEGQKVLARIGNIIVSIENETPDFIKELRCIVQLYSPDALSRILKFDKKHTIRDIEAGDPKRIRIPISQEGFYPLSVAEFSIIVTDGDAIDERVQLSIPLEPNVAIREFEILVNRGELDANRFDGVVYVENTEITRYKDLLDLIRRFYKIDGDTGENTILQWWKEYNFGWSKRARQMNLEELYIIEEKWLRFPSYNALGGRCDNEILNKPNDVQIEIEVVDVIYEEDVHHEE